MSVTNVEHASLPGVGIDRGKPHRTPEGSRKGKSFKCNDCGEVFSYHSNPITRQRIQAGEKPYERNECGKALSITETLLNNKDFTVEKDLVNVIYAEKSLLQAEILWSIKKSTLEEKKNINVESVETILVGMKTWWYIREYTLRKNLMSVRNTGNLLPLREI